MVSNVMAYCAVDEMANWVSMYVVANCAVYEMAKWVSNVVANCAMDELAKWPLFLIRIS